MAVALSAIWEAAQAACLVWSTEKGGCSSGPQTVPRSKVSGNVRSGDSYRASAGNTACRCNYSDWKDDHFAVAL